jgi:hypothetical protein
MTTPVMHEPSTPTLTVEGERSVEGADAATVAVRRVDPDR